MLGTLYAIARPPAHPSVCSSVTWVVHQKRLKLRSCNLYLMVAPFV